MPRTKTVSDDEVLAAARAVFLERGAQAPTTLIAERVGLSQPTLFQRFGDKASLLAAALAAEPIDPGGIVGPPDEPARLGLEAHLEALALRLLEQVLEVVIVTEVAAGGRLLDAGTVRRLHAERDVEGLVTALGEHFSALGLDGPRATEALLLVVHGAAFMVAHADASEREAIERMLRRAVGTLPRSPSSPP